MAELKDRQQQEMGGRGAISLLPDVDRMHL